MKIGILETGLLNEKLSDNFDSYPIMFASLLSRTEHQLEFQAYSVIRGEMPASIHECDGWLITGSRHGAYEKLDWMLELEGIIRDIYRVSVPLVGICFGHQIIAQALGGEVVKSDRGWGIGLQSYAINNPQAWMGDNPTEVRIYAFHQDQVNRLPADAKVFLESDFCPYAGISYGESIITIQAHPEFAEAYEQALIDIYSGNIVPEADAIAAAESMQCPGCVADTQMLAEWIVGFFVSRKARAAA